MFNNSVQKIFCSMLCVVLFTTVLFAQKKDAIPTKGVYLLRNDAEKKVDVFINGKLFTSYIYPSTIKKPVLYPVYTANGLAVTRGYPLEKVAGERIDHPHHVGIWFNYGDVNGLDFWNNSDAIPAAKAASYGTIILSSIKSIKNGNKEGVLEVEQLWENVNKEPLLRENTTFVFSGDGNNRIIDRYTTLTALKNDVHLKDNKEGVYGIRVTRALEHPSKSAELFTDANGLPTSVPVLNNEGVTGKYHSSIGKEGDDVWGTRAEWVNLTGEIQGNKVAIAILDNKQNPGYPTYWHARGYGLFAANPLGQKELSGGKDSLNFMIPAGKSATFKYRMIIQSGKVLTDQQLNQQFDMFGKK